MGKLKFDSNKNVNGIAKGRKLEDDRFTFIETKMDTVQNYYLVVLQQLWKILEMEMNEGMKKNIKNRWDITEGQRKVEKSVYTIPSLKDRQSDRLLNVKGSTFKNCQYYSTKETFYRYLNLALQTINHISDYRSFEIWDQDRAFSFMRMYKEWQRIWLK